MKQIITSVGAAAFGSDKFAGINLNADGWGTPANLATHPWSVAGDFNNLTVQLTQAPGTGITVTLTLMVNGSDTALTVAIVHPATTASDTTHSVTVAPGDVVGWRHHVSSGFPIGHHRLHVEFDSDNTGESGYGHRPSIFTGEANGELLFASVLSPMVSFAWNDDDDLSEEDQYQDIVAIDGAVTRYDVSGRKSSFAALDSGDTLEFALYKNDVRQDGSGGTVNTTVTVTNGSPEGSWTGTLPLAQGDLLRVGFIQTGVSGVSLTAAVSSRFEATTDGEFMLSCNGDPASGSPPPEGRFAAMWGDFWSHPDFGGESEAQIVGGTTTFYVHELFTNANGLGFYPTRYAIIGRVNGANTALAKYGVDIGAGLDMRVTARCSTTAGGGMTVTSGDLWCLMLTTQPYISAAFGIDTTVTVPLAIAFGVDGNTNVHDTPGVVKIFGDLEVTGTITAGAGGISDDLDGLGT